MLGFLLVRVLKRGENSYLPHVSGENLTEFISSGKSVIFFTNKVENAAFANFGIYKYKNYFKFGYANISEGSKYGISSRATAAFEDGKLINHIYYGRNSGPFLRWMNIILQWGQYTIETSEEIRQLLSRSSNTLFAVDLKEIPDKYKDQEVYMVSSDMMKEFCTTVSSGMYLMRGCDRQLIEVGDKEISDLNKCELDSLDTMNIEDKPYIAAFLTDIEDDSFNEDSIELLKKLRKEFGEKVFFISLMSLQHARVFIQAGKLERANYPLFVMFKSDDVSVRRWLLDGMKEEMLDYKYISNFVSNVISGKEHYGYIGKPKNLLDNYGPLKEISASQFRGKVLDRKSPVLVAFTTKWCGQCTIVRPILNATSEILSNTSVKIYEFDCENNEMPKEVPPIDGFPTLYLWHGKSKDPVQYKGKRDIASFIEYFKNDCNITAPSYNETEMLAKYKK